MRAGQEVRGLLRLRALQLLTLVGLLALLVGVCCRLKWGVLDPDVWWHLKTGDWIVQHHSVPHDGIFSRTAADRPWVAYSWCYEVLLSRANAWFGLVGIGLFGVLLTVSVAYILYLSLYRLNGNFWVACLLAVSTCYAFLFNVTPRSVFLSIILFTVVLTLILQANNSGETAKLYYLPPVFLVWANTHIQFIYGLFLVGLLGACTLLQHFGVRSGIAPRWVRPPKLPPLPVFAVFTICALAACIGPYWFRPYQIIFQYLGAKFPYGVINEFQPIDFRSGSHFTQLLLAGAAFFAVAWQRKIDLFKLALLSIAAVVGFRALRDSWFICIPAAACLADTMKNRKQKFIGVPAWETAVVALAVVFSAALFVRNTDFTRQGLLRTIGTEYPVQAVNYLRNHPQRGPLYNPLDWGGFLIWSLPEYPVAIDGRYDLYGEGLSWHFYRSQMLKLNVADRYLDEAGVVLLQAQAPLVSQVMSDTRFIRVYQDSMAVIFARRQTAASAW